METTQNAAGANAAPKKVRRGITNQTSATTQLKFHEKDAAQNNLFVGQLKEVLVDYRTISADNTGLSSFAGLSIPRLVFHFASNHATDAEQRHVYETLLPVESNVATIPGGSDAWRVNNIFRWIKHILDTFYLKGRALSAAEEDALSLSFVDYDDNGEYIQVTPEEVIAGYKTLFEAAASMLNGTYSDDTREATGKPCYKDANGSPIRVWMKLLRAKKQKNEWKNVSQNGELGFDPFIGEGVVELVKTNMPPNILKVDLAKESITPKATEKRQPSIGIPGSPVGGVTIPAGNNFNPNAGAYAEAGEEMPF